MSLSRWIEKNRIRMDVEWTDSNPNMEDWIAGARHFRCTLKRGRKRFTIYFSQGPAYEKEPTVEDVLECLALNSSGFENAASFEEWCREYGYDTDSRKAERTYRIVATERRKLETFLGPELFEELMRKVEI